MRAYVRACLQLNSSALALQEAFSAVREGKCAGALLGKSEVELLIAGGSPYKVFCRSNSLWMWNHTRT